MHILMLKNALGESIFCKQVRVIGSRGLDDLARSRTLHALVWQRMKDLVAAHEHRFTLLEDAASHVAAIGALTRRFGEFGKNRREHRQFWRV